MDKRKRRLLCMLEGSGRKSRWISGVPPLSYKAFAAGMLENYRIYGNTVGGESVGDLVEIGEHAGEYEVSVTVAGKNLLRNTTTSQTYGGVMVTVNSDGSMTCNGTAITNASLRINIGEIPSGIYKLSGCPKNGAYNTYRLDVRDSSDGVIVLDTGNGHLFNSTNAHHVELRIENGYTCENLTFYPMIRRADIEDDTYEPYHAPVTTPIYLPEPIKMVGDEAEYIDYGEQKQHRVRKNLLDETKHGDLGTYIHRSGNIVSSYVQNRTVSDFISVNGNKTYTATTPNVSADSNLAMCWYDINKNYIDGQSYGISKTVTLPSNACYIKMTFDIGDNNMLNEGSTALPYEPYIENTDLDVTLPALPTIAGSNVLTVGTEVQPSEIEVKGKIKAI